MTNNPLVNNLSKMERILNNINWDFYPKPISTDKNYKLFNCRKYHWFPGTFIPEIPYTLIELLTRPGAKVFDPFCGIGTTYFQAMLLKRIPYGADECLFSTEFARLLFRLFKPSANLLEVKSIIDRSIQKYDCNKNYRKMLNNIGENKYLNELRRWYTVQNFNALCFLIGLEREANNRFERAALRLSISSILSTISNQDRGWGCIADNVLPKSNQIKKVDVINVFKIAVSKLLNDINAIKHDTDYYQSYKAIEKNKTIFKSNKIALNEISENVIDIVITSPPYPNMVDYTTSQRLSYYFFGYDIELNKKNETGARYKRRRKSALIDYLSEMEKTNEIISKTIKRGGLLCYVMPSFNTINNNNIKRKQIVQNVISGLEKYDLIKEMELKRSIPMLKRSHNKKWATLDNEIIHIFRKV